MNQKGLAPILLILGILVALGLVGGAYFLGTQKNPAPQANKNGACTLEAKICPDGTSVGRSGPNCEFASCPISNSTSSPTPTAISDQKAGWKTYTNTKYGYSFKAPGDWTVIGGDNGNPVTNSVDGSQMNIQIPGEEIVITVRENSSNKPLKDFASGFIGPGASEEYLPITVNGLDGLTTKFGVATYFIFLQNKQTVYCIVEDQASSATHKLDQIISTFKITQ